MIMEEMALEQHSKPDGCQGYNGKHGSGEMNGGKKMKLHHTVGGRGDGGGVLFLKLTSLMRFHMCVLIMGSCHE